MTYRLFATLFIGCALSASAEDVTFDFHNPASLNPSVNEPGEKSGIDLDGRTFTEGDVSATFSASGIGNTSVRLYHSYDAGIDLRLYDGDALTVSVSGKKFISRIQFTMSLSGAASGSNDINFIPSTGEFVWEDECWTADSGSKPGSVELVSALQSRIYTMTVTVEDASALPEIAKAAGPVRYFNILGYQMSSKPSRPGIYIREAGGVSQKIILQ